MSKRAVIILAVLVLAMVGYIAVFERDSLSSKELEGRKDRVLVTFVRDRIERLELQRKNTRVVLERKTHEGGDFGTWRMLEPDAVAADQDSVDQVLGELEWLSARRKLENISAEDQKRFGLNAPRYRIWYRAGGERHLLTVGSPDVHGQGVYVRIDDEPHAYVVPKTLPEALDHEPWHFRSKEFLGEMTVAWARKIELGGQGKAVVLTRDEQRWWVEDDLRTYADAQRIDRLLTRLDDLRAMRFLTEEKQLEAARAELKSPTRTVKARIVPDAKREDLEPRLIELRVGGVCPGHESERVAQAGPQGATVCVKAEDLEVFQGEPAEFREASLLGVDPSRIEKVELTASGKNVALERDGAKWLGEGDEEVDRVAVERWLADLAAQRALEFSPQASVVETARLTVTLADHGVESFVVGAPGPDGSVQVQRAKESATLRYPSRLADLLEPAPARFASLEPWSQHQPSEVVGVQAREAGLSRSLELHEGKWRSGSQSLPPAEDLRVRELVKSMIKLHARSYVTSRARPAHALSPARAALTLRLRGSDDKPEKGRELRLELGADSGQGVFARVDGGGVLEVPAQVLAQVRELAGGPQAPRESASITQAADEGFDDHHDHVH